MGSEDVTEPSKGLWVKIEKEFVKEFEARSYEILSEFRFDPKDEILVYCYLWKKILFEPLPHDLMRECDVFQTEQWMLQLETHFLSHSYKLNRLVWVLQTLFTKLVRSRAGPTLLLNWQKFFFYDPKERIFENSQKICAGNGQWRELKKGQQIEIYGKEVIAKKNTYVFWKGNDNKFTITN
ncbi:hypothetical protein Fmac_029318 [Flemingia macrophylla]|uniref:NAC domain-containing protein n=1 Tax=Flemingia macrophylla TaxID=520843 RepID=A0ABD1L9Z7_9FABA